MTKGRKSKLSAFDKTTDESLLAARGEAMLKVERCLAQAIVVDFRQQRIDERSGRKLVNGRRTSRSTALDRINRAIPHKRCERGIHLFASFDARAT